MSAKTDRGPADSRASVVIGDTPGFLAYAGLILLAVAVLILTGASTGEWSTVKPFDALAWFAFCAVANLLPAPAARNIHLSMSSPVNVAIAFLFPPSAAATIVVLGSISEWEIKRQTTLLHAAFNRSQLALSTALTSTFFAASTRQDLPVVWIVAAVLAYQASNLAFVSMAEWTSRGVNPGELARGLLPLGGAGVALGLMGLVFALAYLRIGAWAVVLLMIPLLGARHALKVSGELEQAERERRALADRLIDERERERVRIASEIHDVVLQRLAAAEINADNVASALLGTEVEKASAISQTVKGQIAQAVAELRGAIAHLRRDALDEEGLVPTLQRFARSFHAETGIEVRIDGHRAYSEQIPLPVGLLLYECCREALTNVAKHSEAARVDVDLKREGNSLLMTIRDDGVGPGDSGIDPGLGLQLTGDKVALSGGAFWVDGKPGRGTEVTVRIPLRKT